MTTNRFLIIGDWLAAEVNGCTCGTGSAYQHEQYCGVEPVAQIFHDDDPMANPTTLWDMSEIDNPLPLCTPIPPKAPRVWFGGVELKGVKSIETDITWSDDERLGQGF